MPGILPMKVIKVGTSAQSRIAQACDRCRSKKIRCDGIRPCCSQCANVGFECKTSDKLSRRAFPRGYTESLEERVRTLEGEVRELKDLLDEKDEKLDMLSRIHSGSRHSSMSRSSASSSERKPSIGDTKEDTFKVQQSAILLERENPDCYFMGGSSGRSFVDAFKRKIQNHGNSGSAFYTEDFFAASHVTANSRATLDSDNMSTAPPRLVSDQMINIFLQEWSPLFPVLHRPTFLKLYEDYVASPEGLNDPHAIAELNLVFGIAALSAEWNKQDVASFEAQWQPALDSIQSEKTLDTLQCLVLAQIYCISNADYSKLIHYKRIAIGLLHHLGLHQNRKNCSQGALTGETRKKVFWAQYTLDAFSAAFLGLPKLLKEDDIQVEFPSDVDDENVTESGFQSTPPGESTRLSSALALFRVAQILSKVLKEVYPASSSHELSLQKLGALNQELDDWLKDLAPHLRLQFVQDKPSTGTVSSRSPLLSLAYYYIRSLIHRPAVGSGLGSKASSSVMTLADSSKHIIQIIQLLEERRMSFTFCLNRNELLFLSGFGLLYQSVDLDRDGKLIRDSQRLISSASAILGRDSAPGAAEFQKIASSIMPTDGVCKPVSAPTPSGTSISRRKSDSNMPAPQATQRSTRKQLQAIASRFSFGASAHHRLPKLEDHSTRRLTLPTIITDKAPPPAACNNSHRSTSSVRSEPTPHRTDFHPTPTSRPRLVPAYECPNLDYFPLGAPDSLPTPSFPPATKPTPPPLADWDHIFAYTLDSLAASPVADLHHASTPSWIDGWAGTPTPDAHAALTAAAGHGLLGRSELSLSDESLTSGSCEDLSSVEFGAGGAPSEFRGIMMPSGDAEAYAELGCLDGNFGL